MRKLLSFKISFLIIGFLMAAFADIYAADFNLSTDAVSCIVGRGRIIVTINDADPGPYNYILWNGPPLGGGSVLAQSLANPASSFIFINQPAANYFVSVTSPSDPGGKIHPITLSTVQTTALTIPTFTVINGPTCINSSDAKIQANVSGGNPPYTYLWSANAGSQVTQTASGLKAAQTYSVTVNDANSCGPKVGTIFFFEAFYPIDIPDSLDGGQITGTQSVCINGDPSILSNSTLPTGGHGAYTYDWEFQTVSPLGAWTSLGVNNSSYDPPAPATESRNYRRKVTNTCGVVYSNTVTITVNALPVPTATNNGPVCTGQSLILTGGPAGMTSYSWSGPNGYTSTLQSPTVSASATIAMAGLYTLTVVNGSGCTNSATTTVVVNISTIATAANSGPVCVGQPLSLTGGPAGMTSYSWTGPNGFISNVQSPVVSASATVAMAGLYTLTVVNAIGCSNTTTTTAVVNALPVATATNNGPVCTGNPLTLTGGPAGMTSYAWTGPNGFTSILQSPTVSASATVAMAGLYTLTVVDASGCSNSSNTTVVVNISPVGTASNNGPVCVGQALALIGGPNGMASYSWTGPNGFSSNLQSPPVSGSVTLAMAGVYTLTVVNPSGCSNSVSTNVVVNSLPAATASNSGPVCVGQSLSLTGGPFGMVSYSWTGPNGFTSILQSPTVSAAATAAMAGLYTLTVVDASGCSNTATTIAVVNALPIATAANNGPVCVGKPLTLTGGPAGMTSYSWTGPNGYTSILQSPTVSASATIAMAGIYTLTVVNGSGCSNTATTTAVVNALPVPTAANNGPVCVGQPLTLTGGPAGMTSYAWTGPNGFTSILQSPTVSASATVAMAGIYTLTVVNGSGCSNSAITTAVVNALPVPTAANNGPVCVGQPLNLTGGPAGMTTYSWTGPNGFTSILQSPIVSASATVAMAGLYTLTVINASGCSNTATTTAIVNALPVPTAANNGPVCVGQPLTLTGGPAGMTSYAWTGPNGYTSILQSPTVSASATAAMAGLYTLTVVNASGCSNTGTTTAVVNALPVPTASNNGPVCVGQPLNLTGGPIGMSSYSWSGPNGFTSIVQSPVVSASATAAMAGLYTLTVTNGSGCSNTATTTAVVNTLPVATAANNGPVCVGQPLTLTGGPAGMTSYAWTGPNGFISNVQSPIVSASATIAMAGLYTLTVVNASGCTNTATTTAVINTLPVPTAVNNSPVCTGQQLTLTGGPVGMTSYSWTGPNGFASILQSPIVSASATSAMSGLYTLTVVNGTCSNNANTTVFVIDAPIVFAGNDTAICNESSLQISNANVQNESDFTWGSTGTGTFSNIKILNPIYTPSIVDRQAGSVMIYLDAVGNAPCGNVTDSFKLTISSPVTPSIGSPAPFYIGSNTKIQVCLSTNDHQLKPDIGYYMIAPDGKTTLTLKKGLMEFDFFSPPCFPGGSGDANNLCFTTELPITDTLNLCPPASNPLSGTYAATGAWNILYGMNPAQGGWAVMVKDTAAQRGGIDGAITNATISFIDTATATHQLTTIDYSSGAINIPIAEPTTTEYIVPRGLRVSCADACDAIGLVNVTGGTPPYTNYQWSPIPGGGNGKDSVVFCAGTYNLTVTDALGCSGSTSVDVLAPPAILINSESHSDSLICFGDSTGFINVKASGGTGTLHYTLLPGNIVSASTDSGYFAGLKAGVYTVIIKDSKNCFISTSVTINQTAQLVILSAVVTDSVFCTGDNNGRIFAVASGGTAPYTFILSPVDSISHTGIFSNLGPGTYVVKLTDSHGCDTVSSASLILGVPIPLQIDTVIAGPIRCNGGTGTLTIVTIGGKKPYNITINGTLEQSGVGDTAIVSKAAGIYNITSADANGCNAVWSSPVTLTDPPAMHLDSVHVTDISTCFNSPAGKIAIFASGGSSTIEYSLDGITYQSDTLFSNLNRGNYTLYYRDSVLRCVQTSSATINSPPMLLGNPVVTDIQGDNLGSIVFHPTGGTSFSPPNTYLYSINGGVLLTTNIFDSLSVGTYLAHVQDSLGCPWDSTIIIGKQNLDINLTAINPKCKGSDDGMIILRAINGKAPYSLYINGDFSNPFPVVDTIDHLLAATYNIRVDDKDGKRFTDIVKLIDPDTIVVHKAIVNPACQEFDLNGGQSNNGQITLTSSGGVGHFTYSWNDIGTNDSTRTGLIAGTYVATIKDGNLCTVKESTVLNGQVIIDARIGMQQTSDLTSPMTYPSDTTVCYLSDWTLSAIHGGSGTPVYLWTPDTLLNNPSDANKSVADITMRHSSSISLKVTLNQCYDSAQLRINTFDTIGMHIISDVAPKNDTIYVPLGIPFGLSASDNFSSYLWISDPNAEIDNTTNQKIQLTPNENLTLAVVGTNTASCKESDTTYIVIQEPLGEYYSVFTPNGDGVNDYWQIGANAKEYFDIEVFIYNRWGQLVFHSKHYGIDETNKWYGKSMKNGKDLQIGTYYFIVKPNNATGKDKAGTVTIVR